MQVESLHILSKNEKQSTQLGPGKTKQRKKNRRIKAPADYQPNNAKISVDSRSGRLAFLSCFVLSFCFSFVRWRAFTIN